MTCTTLPKAEIVRKYESGESVQALADSHGRSYATMHENLVRWGASLRRRGPPRTYAMREDFFDVIDTEEKAYWLGFAFADGSVVQTGAGNWTLRVELKWSDRSHLRKLMSALQTNSPVKQGSRRDKRTGRRHKSAYVCICSVRLCRDLMRLGCIPNKTCGHPIPRLRKELLRHFYRGETDGDGSLFISRGSARYELIGTPEMTQACQEFLMAELGLSKTKRIPGGNALYVRYTGNLQVRRIARLLYEDASIFLDRKMETYRRLVA